MIEADRLFLQHFLAALAYRTQKALRDSPRDFGDFSPGSGVRTPKELVRHMSSVLGYARTFFVGGVFVAEPLESLELEVTRFHDLAADLAAHLRSGTHLELTPLQLLQGPFADAMTHAGQLALLRRLAGSPVASENFIMAAISADNLGSDQPQPAAPTPKWIGRLIHLGWRFTKWYARLRRAS